MAGRTYKSNGAASDVQLRVVDLQHVLAVDGHGSESLVELDEVDVLDVQAVLGQQLWDGDGRADAHDPGCETRDGGADELGQDGLAQLESLGALHEQHGGRAVGHLAAVTAGRPVAEVWEGGADLVQSLESGAPSRSLVFGQSDLLLLAGLGVLDLDSDGGDLVLEPSGLLRRLGAAVGFGSVPVLLLARDVEVLAHVLRSLAHGLQAVGGVLVGVDDVVDEGSRQTVAAGAHVLGADCQTDLNGTGLDLGSDVLHGFESG